MALKSKGLYDSLLCSNMEAILKQREEISECGTGNDYDTLLRALSDPDTEAHVIIHCLQELEKFINLLTKDYSKLVSIILNLDWLDKGGKLAAEFHSFLLNLVSAQVFYLNGALTMLVKKFVPDEKKIAAFEAGEAKMKIEQDFTHVHALLKSLARIVPMTSVLLVPILEEKFPYLNKGAFWFENYTRSILAVSSYIPALRMDILTMIVKQMLKLDVRSPRQDISTTLSKEQEGEEDREEDMEDTVFKMEEDMSEEASSEASQSERADLRLSADLPMAASLDRMLGLMFQFIKDSCYHKRKLNWEVTKKLYRELLSTFDKYMFPTHASCHVQFIMFYICSYKEELADGFLDYLWKRVTDPNSQSVYRQIAAYYIGSFLSRANYVTLRTAKESVELQVRWIHKYLDTSCEQGIHADITHHAAFYAVCQCVFYVFCFKHNDFLQMKRGYKWAESLNFQRIITSKLNPLKVCAPIIVKTFASATRTHQLAFCDTIIERNNRYKLPVVSTSTLELPCMQELESYFPFDPYLLPRSSSWIVPLYKEFKGAVSDDADDEEKDDDEDDFLPEEDALAPTNDISMSLGKSPADFLHYGTSPGFQHA